jgi:hypothetical protein
MYDHIIVIFCNKACILLNLCGTSLIHHEIINYLTMCCHNNNMFLMLYHILVNAQPNRHAIKYRFGMLDFICEAGVRQEISLFN